MSIVYNDLLFLLGNCIEFQSSLSSIFFLTFRWLLRWFFFSPSRSWQINQALQCKCTHTHEQLFPNHLPSETSTGWARWGREGEEIKRYPSAEEEFGEKHFPVERFVLHLSVWKTDDSFGKTNWRTQCFSGPLCLLSDGSCEHPSGKGSGRASQWWLAKELQLVILTATAAMLCRSPFLWFITVVHTWTVTELLLSLFAICLFCLLLPLPGRPQTPLMVVDLCASSSVFEDAVSCPLSIKQFCLPCFTYLWSF